MNPVGNAIDAVQRDGDQFFVVADGLGGVFRRVFSLAANAFVTHVDLADSNLWGVRPTALPLLSGAAGWFGAPRDGDLFFHPLCRVGSCSPDYGKRRWSQHSDASQILGRYIATASGSLNLAAWTTTGGHVVAMFGDQDVLWDSHQWEYAP